MAPWVVIKGRVLFQLCLGGVETRDNLRKINRQLDENQHMFLLRV
jgi:hypothetical protein